MSRPRRHHVLTLQDYLDIERSSGRKHEFTDGQILLMAGGSPRHNAITANLLHALVGQLRGTRYRAFASDLRISTEDGLYTYADATVVCGPVLLGWEQTATNPALLVEVLSDSTRGYDRGDKLERYQTIPSLRHVLLVEQSRVDVEHWFRTENGWERRVHTGADDVVVLHDPDISISLSDVYAGTADLDP